MTSKNKNVAKRQFGKKNGDSTLAVPDTVPMAKTHALTSVTIVDRPPWNGPETIVYSLLIFGMAVAAYLVGRFTPAVQSFVKDHFPPYNHALDTNVAIPSAIACLNLGIHLMECIHRGVVAYQQWKRVRPIAFSSFEGGEEYVSIKREEGSMSGGSTNAINIDVNAAHYPKLSVAIRVCKVLNNIMMGVAVPFAFGVLTPILMSIFAETLDPNSETAFGYYCAVMVVVTLWIMDMARDSLFTAHACLWQSCDGKSVEITEISEQRRALIRANSSSGFH